MDFTLSDEQHHIRAAVTRLCADFGAAYWLEKDTEGGFPHEFYAAMARAGWLGVAMPAEYGGAGVGITRAGPVLGGVGGPGGWVFPGPAVSTWNVWPHVALGFLIDALKERV